MNASAEWFARRGRCRHPDMRSIDPPFFSQVPRFVRTSAALLACLSIVVVSEGAYAAESTPPSARGVVTPSEPAKPAEPQASAAPQESKPKAAPGTSRVAAKASQKSTRNQRKTAKRTSPSREKAAAAAATAATAAATGAAVASTAAATAGKTDLVPSEPAEKPRPALVVDGAAAASQQAAESARTTEIEVRVSATQRRENLYRDAVNALSEGRTDEGVKQLQQILAEHPGQDNARQILIGVALRARQFARAEALADDRLAHGNEHLGFAVVSARLKIDRSDPVAALDVLKRSEVHAGSNPEYQALMAAVLQRLSRHGEAAERFRAALALQPGTGIWQMGLGVSLQALERPVEAIEAFRRARDGAGLTPELRAFVDERVAELQR